jgi:hypothetical protein
MPVVLSVVWIEVKIIKESTPCGPYDFKFVWKNKSPGVITFGLFWPVCYTKTIQFDNPPGLNSRPFLIKENPGVG